ncbi:MAG: hypothetical protein F6K16_27010 [Symploca sp. SIO2B6]|nr:hypothetical protein [Symploca sp. SIO2B6]
MNPPQPKDSSVLEDKLSDNSQSNNPAKTIPTTGSKSETASAELWESIKTIIGLQNQAPPLVTVSKEGNLPLSFPQERLWFLEQLESANSSYNIPFTFRLKGVLNISALEQSLNEILRRHQALRTNFSSVEGKPVQVIASTVNLTLSVVDLQDLPTQERENKAMQLATESAQQPFELTKEPLFRANLLKLTEQEHILLLNIHHIVFDGWSEGVLFKELATLYEAFTNNKPSPLPELPIQYPDFAPWQRQWLQGEFLEALLSYWKQQLGGKVSELQLPTDHPQPVSPTRVSACQKFVLSKELTQSIKTLSRQEGATLFATLLAAFKILLHRYTEQDNLFVCSPIANRNRKELRGLVGYFVNLLILRTDFSGNPSFKKLLTQVRQGASGAYAHQDLPLQQLVNHLNLGKVPLSQVMFVLQNTPQQVPNLPGLEVDIVDIDNGMADFDLSLSMVEEAGELIGTFKYNTDLFEEKTISQMRQHFQTVLEQVVANPEQPLSLLLPLSESEQQQLQAMRLNSASKSASEQALEREKNFVAPRDAIETQLTKLWEEVLDIRPIGIKDNFFELGGYSLVAVRLIAEIEKAFNKNITLPTIFQAPTVEELAKILTQEESSTSGFSLVPVQPKGSKPPLFAIHYLGTNMRWYRPLSVHLGLDQPIYGLVDKLAIENLLDEQKAMPSLKVEEIAAYYIQEMRTVQPEGPYFMSGISFGGAIAFEMAQQLHAQGQKVGLLALFDTLGPDGSSKISTPRQGVSSHLKNLLTLPPQAKIKYLQEQVRNKSIWLINRVKDRFKKPYQRFTIAWRKLTCSFYLAIGRSLPQELLDFRASAANNQARIDYVPKVYPGRVTMFRALDSYLAPGNPDMGWGKLAGGGLDIHYVPGGHSSMYNEPHVQVLAEKLKACLEQGVGS